MTVIGSRDLRLEMLFSGGAMECPVVACGCEHQHIQDVSKLSDPYGNETVVLKFFCEWGHRWNLGLTEVHGQTLYSIHAWEDYGEVFPVEMGDNS